MGRIVLLFIFAVVSLADLYHVYIDGVRSWTKPVIMLTLGGYYLLHYKEISSTSKFIFLVAIIAAWTGDVFLLWDDRFLYGLSSFLIMQVLYSIAFWKDRSLKQSSHIYGALLLLSTVAITAFLWDSLGDMIVPVIIYTLAIGLMSFTAFERDRELLGYWMVFVGTLLFVISDTVLGIHQFTDIHLGKLTVMGTYILAQYFIIVGYIKGHTQ